MCTYRVSIEMSTILFIQLLGSAALPLSHVDTFEMDIADWTRRCWSIEQGTTCDHAEKSKRIPLVTRVHDTFEEVQRTSNSCPKVRHLY